MTSKERRRLTGYIDQESAESLLEDYEDEEEDVGSILSIPDDDIDFDLVYALHTFTATVEGQATVVRGDALTLLDDSNSYWWLIKVLKTAEIGYIPAENVETPYERLARLNSHRNVEITRKDINGFPIPPNKIKKHVTLAREVQYQSQFIYSDDSSDCEALFESEYHEWDEKMQSSDSDLGSSDEEYPIESQSSSDEEETIRISLTPSIARVDEGYKPMEKKNAEKLEKLLIAGRPEKKEKKGIRKFFSRKRRASSDSTASTESSTRLMIQPGHDLMEFSDTWVDVYPSTTAEELLSQIVPENEEEHYYLMVKSLSGDALTLVPSDKPLEIFDSLTTPLNTPMPSLKKARRISLLMGSDVGGPTKEENLDQVQFLLFSKTRRPEDGEFQIKVSLMPHDRLDGGPRMDKLVRIRCNLLVEDAISLFLEKFQIQNAVVANEELDDESNEKIAKYQLEICREGQECILPLNETISSLFGDDAPPIFYRRNSNPDRSSITSNITPPEKDETYFRLKCVQRPKKEKPQLVRHNTPMPRKDHSEVKHERLPDTRKRESMLISTEDFGMNDLMIMIRHSASTGIDMKKLDQLETELDRIFFESIRIYN